MPTERELRQAKDEEGPKGRELPSLERVFAACSYVGVLFIVPMIAAKRTDFIRFHLRQGIIMFVAEVAASVFGWLPFVGWLFGIAVFVLAVMGVLQALAGERRPLPFVGKYATRINL